MYGESTTVADRQTTVRIWQENEIKLKAIAEQRGLNFSRMVNVALAEWLASQQGAKDTPNDNPLDTLDMFG